MGFIDTEGPENNIITQMKLRRLSTATTKHLTPAVVNIKNPVNVDPSRTTKPKERMKISDSGLLSLFMRDNDACAP